jgi:hypothetical protein
MNADGCASVWSTRRVSASITWMPCSRYPLKTATMWRESGENVIVTGIEPSGIDVPTGSSRVPVGSRYGSGASWRHPPRASTAARANAAMRANAIGRRSRRAAIVSP